MKKLTRFTSISLLILCLGTSCSFSENGQGVQDYAKILTLYQKRGIEKLMSDFKKETGIRESLVIANQKTFFLISDSLSQNYKSLNTDSVRRILFIVDAGNQKIYVAVSHPLKEEFSDSVATRMFRDFSVNFVKENRIYEGVLSGITSVNAILFEHFKQIHQKEIDKAKSDSVRLKAGYRSKDDSPAEEKTRTQFMFIFFLAFAGFMFCVLVVFYFIIRRYNKNEDQINELRTVSEKMITFLLNLSIEAWPQWAKNENKEVDHQHSFAFRNKFTKGIKDLPSSFFGATFYPRDKIKRLEEDLKEYESYYIKVKKISADVDLFCSRVSKAIQFSQEEIESMSDLLSMMEKEGFGTSGFRKQLISLRGDFEKLEPLNPDSHRGSFLGAYKIHLALLQMKYEINEEKESKKAYIEKIETIEEYKSIVSGEVAQYKEDYKKWMNSYSARVLKQIASLESIKSTFDVAEREIVKAEGVLTSNRDDKYAFVVACLNQAEGLFISVQSRIKAGRQAEQKIVALKEGYSKRYSQMVALVNEVNEMVFDSDFPMSEGDFIDCEQSIAELNRSMERVVFEAKLPHTQIDWGLIDIILTSIEGKAKNFLSDCNNEKVSISNRHGIRTVPNNIRRHKPFNGFGS